MEQILALANVGIAGLDRQLRCQVWNPYLEKLFDLPAAAAMGMPPSEIFPACAEAGLEGRFQKAIGGEASFAVEWSFAGPLGEPRRVALDAHPFRATSGEVTSVLVFVRDRTDQQRREPLHAENERNLFLQQVLDGVPVGVFVVNRDGQPIYANRAAFEILGEKLHPEAKLEEIIENETRFGSSP